MLEALSSSMPWGPGISLTLEQRVLELSVSKFWIVMLLAKEYLHLSVLRNDNVDTLYESSFYPPCLHYRHIQHISPPTHDGNLKQASRKKDETAESRIVEELSERSVSTFLFRELQDHC